MEQTKTGQEILVKIIGEGEDKRFFNSLADALRAFLKEEISQITIEGQDASFRFGSHSALIGKKDQGEFAEFFIEAPIVSLKILGYNEEMSEFPQLNSLLESFRAFFEKKIRGLQIYEQIYIVGGIFDVAKNYAINFNWDEKDPQKILLHCHNIDVENHYWREDFQCWRHKCGDFVLTPIFGPPHTITGLFFKN